MDIANKATPGSTSSGAARRWAFPVPILIFGCWRRCWDPAGQDAVRAKGLCGRRQRHGGHLLGHPAGAGGVRCYLISAFCVATAGLIQASRTMGAQNTVGQGLELEVLAAVILGGASLLGGSGTIFKTVIGVLILGFIQNGLLLVGLQFYVQFVVTWIIIILAVWLDIAAKRGKLWSPIA
jgi:ribose transport system permease protein